MDILIGALGVFTVEKVRVFDMKWIFFLSWYYCSTSKSLDFPSRSGSVRMRKEHFVRCAYGSRAGRLNVPTQSGAHVILQGPQTPEEEGGPREVRLLSLYSVPFHTLSSKSEPCRSGERVVTLCTGARGRVRVRVRTQSASHPWTS